jgi:transposase-like protein
MDNEKKQPCRTFDSSQISKQPEEINPSASKKRNGKQISFEFKIHIIEQINNGQISLNYASNKYNVSRSTIEYWIKKLSNYADKSNRMGKEQEIKKLKERIQELEFIKDFQQDMIAEFEQITGEELSKKYLPEHLAKEIQKRKRKPSK